MKKLLGKLKKKPFPTDTVPRTEAELSKAYAELALKAGSAQYQVHVYTRQLEQLNRQMEALNNEGAARQKLDAETKKQQEAVGEITEVKNA